MSKPRVVSKVYYKGEYVGKVKRVDGNICWVRYPEHLGGLQSFIWRFKSPGGYEELNNLHEWEGKHGVESKAV